MQEETKGIICVILVLLCLLSIPALIETCTFNHKYTPTFVCERCGKFVWENR